MSSFEKNQILKSEDCKTKLELMRFLLAKELDGKELSLVEQFASVAMCISGIGMLLENENQSMTISSSVYVGRSIEKWINEGGMTSEQKDLFRLIMQTYPSNHTNFEQSIKSIFKSVEREKECDALLNPNKTYIVREKGTSKVKIGRSRKVGSRIKTLIMQSGCDLEVLCIVNEDIEQSLHARFSSLRTVGEWFIDADGEIALLARRFAGEAA